MAAGGTGVIHSKPLLLEGFGKRSLDLTSSALIWAEVGAHPFLAQMHRLDAAVRFLPAMAIF